MAQFRDVGEDSGEEKLPPLWVAILVLFYIFGFPVFYAYLGYPGYSDPLVATVVWVAVLINGIVGLSVVLRAIFGHLTAVGAGRELLESLEIFGPSPGVLRYCGNTFLAFSVGLSLYITGIRADEGTVAYEAIRLGAMGSWIYTAYCAARLLGEIFSDWTTDPDRARGYMSRTWKIISRVMVVLGFVAPVVAVLRFFV